MRLCRKGGGDWLLRRESCRLEEEQMETLEVLVVSSL